MSLRPSSANIGYKYLIYIYGHDQYVLWLMRTVRVCVLLWNLHQVNYLQSQAVVSCHSLAAADPAERLCFERGHCPCWGCRSSRYPGRSSPAIWKQKCNLSTHWVRVTHLSNIIGSDNSLSPCRRQAIIWTNAGMLLIGPLGTNFNDILIEIHTYSSRKPILKCGMEKLVILSRPQCVKSTSWYHGREISLQYYPFSDSFHKRECEVPGLIIVYLQFITTVVYWYMVFLDISVEY